ncbi:MULTISPECIES: restriction endonuclease subunit S [Bacteroides]|uniref:restriction endonuclease subunit S n=2 Tax=Bacteroides TaxID=816 RepID=UPI001F46FEC5|nr:MULTISPECIES: restriction endonuclease subunit S [Bacteroides]
MTTMAIDNKDKKVLKSSIEREQNEVACSAECEKIKGSKNLNVPPLRFPEFTEEWKAEQLDNIATLSKGIGISKEQLSEDGEPCILYGELYTKYKSEIIKQVESKTDINGSKLKRSKANDVIIPCSGETAVDIATARCVPFDNILFGGDLNVISLHQYDGAFMSYQLNGKRKYDIARVAQGVSIVHLYGEHLKAIKTYNPTLPEQQKIAKLLSLLDDRIDTQNKIIEKLQSLIKGLRVCCMQRVYGNNVYLSEIAQIYQPQTISSTELTEDGFLVYGANGIIGKYKDYNHETEQICITCRGNTCGMVNYTKPMSWITGNAMVINTDKYQDKVCKRYLYHYLSAYNFNSIISGSGQPQIVRTPLEKLKITLPTISEQKQKAIIFDKIQDKIDINHKVLNLYIGQKQYLLRQMFI